MWTALRTDLREFVSTVAEESSTALTAIDAKLQNIEGDRYDDSAVVDEDGNLVYEKEEEATLAEMIGVTETPPDVVYDSEDLAELLENEEVKEAFDSLVPEKMTVEDFYARYIEVQKNFGEEVNVLSSMKNFMEGVGRAVAPLQGGLRPPFVMNTAVDEDDENEEELGWDEDEEENQDEGWQERLTQTEEERDVLQQTVELQRKELEGVVKEKTDLKHLVQEKENILDGIKASLEGEDKKFVEKICEQEAAITKLEKDSAKKTEDLKEMEEQNKNYEGLMQKLNDELQNLKNEMKEKDKELDDGRSKMAPMVDEIKLLKNKLDSTTPIQASNEGKEEDDVSGSSPSSLVKVVHDEAKPSSKPQNGEEEDYDDWGDAWGDDNDLETE